MLSAIISDTLLLKSPTTTDRDKEVDAKLAELAGVNLDDYGIALLKSGTNVDNKDAEEIVDGDAKSFDMGDYKVRIGQINVVDIDDVLNRKDEMLEKMQGLSIDNGYDTFLLIVTNILTNDSEGLVVGKEELLPYVGQAFDAEVNDSQLPMPGVVSRKKQVVPVLTAKIEG